MSFHKNDEGTAFTITFVDGGEILDISSAIVREITFKKPNNGATVGPKTLTVPNGGEDGVGEYIVEASVLDTVGEWSWQAYIEFPSGKFHAYKGKFTVYDNLS